MKSRPDSLLHQLMRQRTNLAKAVFDAHAKGQSVPEHMRQFKRVSQEIRDERRSLLSAGLHPSQKV